MVFNLIRVYILRVIYMSVVILWLKVQYDRMTSQKDSLLPESLISGQQPRRHIGYLKVHKTGSGTIQNIFARFALNRNVTVVLPSVGIHIADNPDGMAWKLLPIPKHYEFEMLFNHVIFKARRFRAYLPNDTIYIASVRHPFKQFISAFVYIRSVYVQKYIKNISSASPIHSFLTNPSTYESNISLSWTHNSMARDFGYPSAFMDDITLFKKYVNKLGDFFHLVIVLERFDESMVVMRRLLNWSVKDIIYIKMNVQKKNITIKGEDQNLHRKWSKLDYILYEFFNKKLNRQIAEQKNGFFTELSLYKQLLNELQDFCQNDKKSTLLVIDKTNFSPEFTVSKNDCKLILTREKDLMNVLKTERLEKLKKFGENNHYLRKLHDTVKWSPSLQVEF